MDGIKVIALELSTKCGADCLMCPHRELPYPYEDMPMELVTKAVDEACNLYGGGVELINLCGMGDGVMCKHFEEVLKYIKNNYPCVKVALSSTCQFLDGDKIDLVCKYVDSLDISCYGVTKTTYESIHRGSLVYEKVMKNIEQILSRKDRPYITMYIADMPENHDEIGEWREKWENVVDQINIWKLKYWNGFIPNPEPNRQYTGCIRVRTLNGLYVNTDGSISACCNDWKRAVIIGNLYDNTLQEIIDGEEATRLQKMNDDGTLIYRDFCKECEMLRDRSDALIYSSNREMKAGMHSSLPGDTSIFGKNDNI